MRMEAGNLITVLFGLAFVGAGVYLHMHTDRFLDTAREATGTVTELSYGDSQRKTRVHPVLRYTTTEGRPAEGRSWQHYNAEVGQALPLLYDPADPTHVEIGSRASQQRTRTIMTAVCIAFGVAISLIGVGLELGVLNWRPAIRR